MRDDVQRELQDALKRVYAVYGPDLSAFFRDVDKQIQRERVALEAAEGVK